jgi:hypothetical protein
MRIRIKESFLFLALVTPQVSLELNAQDYSIEEMRDEETIAAPPFTISRVLPFDGGLRLFLSTNNPDAVSELLSAGALQAQISDHEAETETAVPLLLRKAVWCDDTVEPVYLSYGDPLPGCNDNPPARIEYLFEVAAVLDPGRDLAIGQNPDFLWLIEER